MHTVLFLRGAAVVSSPTVSAYMVETKFVYAFLPLYDNSGPQQVQSPLFLDVALQSAHLVYGQQLHPVLALPSARRCIRTWAKIWVHAFVYGQIYERRGNNKVFEFFHPKAKARILRWSSCVCHIDSTADYSEVNARLACISDTQGQMAFT